MDRQVYLDHAATTPVRKEVVDFMLPYLTESFGNPSSVYKIARKNKEIVDDSRMIIAKAIGASSEEVFFTSGGSESDNWAIKGVAWANKNKGNHIITTNIEHHAVLHTCEWLEKNGFTVTYVPVDQDGRVKIDELKEAITDETILITVMMANNEIGTIQPIKEIVEIAKEKGVLVHTDAVQALGNVPIDVKELGVDLLSVSGHKVYGPKGIGALYVRKGVRIQPLIHGGSQERKRRAGTENVPSIAGFAKAVELSVQELPAYTEKITALKDKLIKGVQQNIPFVRFNGHPEMRLPGNVNMSFEFIEGEALLLMLDMKGIYASSGSACTSGSLDPSHVLLAIGLPHEIAHGSLRLSLGKETTEEDIDYVLDVLPPIVQRLRDMSPLYEEVVKNNKQ